MQISGLTTSTRFTLPAATMSRATLMPKVADEHATFMSNAKPFVPSASCTSTETAGYARCRFEHATMTAPMSAGARLACARRLASGGERHLALDRVLLVRALGDARREDRGIEDPRAIHRVPAADAGRVDDELGARALERLHLAARDARGVLLVLRVDVGVERRDQLVVRDGVGRGEESGSGDGDGGHGQSSATRRCTQGAARWQPEGARRLVSVRQMCAKGGVISISTASGWQAEHEKRRALRTPVGAQRRLFLGEAHRGAMRGTGGPRMSERRSTERRPASSLPSTSS